MKMKHLNGKQEAKTKKTIKKTSPKPGFPNSKQSYPIIYMNLRSRCIGKANISRNVRSYQLKRTLYTNNLNISSIECSVEFWQEKCYTGLNTFKNKAVTFFFENGNYEIFVEDLPENEERGLLYLEYFTTKNSYRGDALVVLAPQPSDIRLQLHANDQNDLELHKHEHHHQAQRKKLFFMHSEGSGFVSFESFYARGFYIGVKENRLELMKKKEGDEAFMFKLTK
ncbi:interleukin-33 isoform X2 [Monodelphis domestica]|nr:interleukin-33 isoform X2 [Monodelphis domestica]